MSIPFDRVQQWVSATTLTWDAATQAQWCQCFDLVPSPDAALWQTMVTFADQCPVERPPRELTTDKQLRAGMSSLLRAVCDVRRVTLSPWMQFSMGHMRDLAVQRIADEPQLWPIACTPQSWKHIIHVWRQQATPCRRTLLNHFVVFCAMAHNAVAPTVPAIKRSSSSLVGGDPFRLVAAAKALLAKQGWRADAAGWRARLLAFLLGSTPRRQLAAVPPPPLFFFCGDLAQIIGIERGLATTPPRAGVVTGATVLAPTTPGGAGDPRKRCAVLSVHATTGKQELLCVDGGCGAVLGRTKLQHAVTLVQGVPFAGMAAVVEQETRRLTFFQWSPAEAAWRVAARLELGRVQREGLVSWARMCAEPPLLAWAQVADFTRVLRSSGEALPLKHVHVAEWRMQSQQMVVTTVAATPQATFDTHFGGSDTAASHVQQPAALFDAQQDASIVWCGDDIVLRVDGARVSACWRHDPKTLVAARAWPPALIWVSTSGPAKGAWHSPSVVAVQDAVTCTDAAPLLVSSV